MLNETIRQAIEEAVSEEGQASELTSKILAWMEALTDGNEDIADPSHYKQRCALCFENTVIPQNVES